MIQEIKLGNFDPTVRKMSLSRNEEKIVLVTLGPGSYLVSGTFEYGTVDSHILIGRYCSLAHKLTFICGLNHDGSQVTTYPFEDLYMTSSDGVMNHYFAANHYQIIIGNDVWIGRDVTILGGVKIGNGAIIGAGSVVAKDIPPYAIAVGNPAQVVRYRFSSDIIDNLQRIKWWNWPEDKIKRNIEKMKDPQQFVEMFAVTDKYNDSEIGENIRLLREQGKAVYLFIADFSVDRALWKKVLQQYYNTFKDCKDVILLFAAEKREIALTYMNLAEQMWNVFPNNRPTVAFLDSVENCLQYIVCECKYFITTREDVCSMAIDYAEGYGVKIVSGLDNCIFK